MNDNSAGWILDPLQLNRVTQIVKSKNKNFSQLATLAGLDPKKDFKNMNLDGIDFENSDLSFFDFSGSSMRSCVFSDSNLVGTVFSGTDLLFSKVSSSQLEYLREKIKNYNQLTIDKIDVISMRQLTNSVVSLMSELYITKTDLCDMSDLSYGAVNRFLNGENVNLTTVLKIVRSMKSNFEKSENISKSLEYVIESCSKLEVGAYISFERKRHKQLELFST